jgi:pyrimidine deaminase RibD-like protein
MPLNDIERAITLVVVGRFMNSKDATKRKDLVTQFKSPQSVDRLIKVGVLKMLDNDGNLIPSALGVVCSDDADSVTRAKSSVEIVLQALQNIYEVTPPRKQITRNDVQLEIDRILGKKTVPEVVQRGLYFVKEFAVLDAHGPSPGQMRPAVFDLEWMEISERIVTVDVKNAWDDHVRAFAATLESIINEGGAVAPKPSLPVDDDQRFMQMAIEEARKSIPEDGRVHPRVGAVVVKDGHVLAKAHRGEFPEGHAEYIALEKKLTDVSLSGATVYTTLEPCTTRNHPKVPCAIRLTERKVHRVVIGMLDPDDKISGRGQRALRKAGIVTDFFPHDLMSQVEELNRDFARDRESRENDKSNAKTEPRPEFHNYGGNPGPIKLGGRAHSVQGPWTDVYGVVTIVNPTQVPMKIGLSRLVLGGKECAVHSFFFRLKSHPMERFERISLMGNTKEDYQLHVMFPDAEYPVPPSGDGELWVSNHGYPDFPLGVRFP